MNNLTNALIFIITTLFELYIALVLIRVVLQYIRAPFHNPISQFIINVTNPGFKIFRKFIPGFFGIDFAGIIFAYLLAMLELVVINIINYHTVLFNLGYLVMPLFMLLSTLLTIFFWAIIIRVITSFMAHGYALHQNPFFTLCYMVSEPILRPIRNIVPPIAGFDLSPLFACLLISVLRILFNIY